MQKILIIGATGAMGSYLTEKTAAAGLDVTAVSLDDMTSKLPNLHYVQMKDAANAEAAAELAAVHYDAIVDFMTYKTVKFRQIVPIYLKNTAQYFFLSSCRVFANEEVPITERSPRLVDVSTDDALLKSDDYCMYKARSEDFLRASRTKNWTIIRPSTTYSRKRCQLLTLERNKILECLRENKPALLYEASRKIPASLNWGADVADMIHALMFKDAALGEDFNVTTDESHTWEEIASYYGDLFGLKYEWVSEDEYQHFLKPDFDPIQDINRVYQLRYARMFNRVYDNTKMLKVTGLKQDQFTSLYDGLKHERPTILADD